MDWNPDREKRIRQDEPHPVPRDRQLVAITVSRPGGVQITTDTLYPVRCPTCGEVFNGPTNWQSTHQFSDHVEDGCNYGYNQYELPGWFRELKESGDAEIFDLMGADR